MQPNEYRIPPPGDGTRLRLLRLIPFVFALLATALVFAFGLHRELTLEAIVHKRMELGDLIAAHNALAVALYVAAYIAVAALSLPGAALMTVAGGLLFGTAIGATAAVIGATIGATLVFLIARGAVGGFLYRCGGAQVAAIAEGFREDAFNYLLFLRVVPVFPFWLVNLVPAVCGVPLRTFVLATFIGIIPLAIIGAFFGASLVDAVAAQEAAYRTCVSAGKTVCKMNFDITDAFTPRIIIALVAVGLAALLPVIAKHLCARRSKKSRSDK